MKKSIVLISTALVLGAILQGRAEDEVIQNPDDWFVGIGANPTTENNLNADKAAWDLTTGVTEADSQVSVVDNALKLSLMGDDYVVLTPNAPQDTNTVTTLDVTTVISAVEELPTIEETAQTALVVHEGAYKVWDGEQWRTLTGTPTRGPVALKVELSYADMKTTPARTAFFTIGGGARQEVALKGAALAADRLTHVTCSGMTTISEINGKVELGYAKNNEVKYPTVAAAQAAAKEGTDKTIVLLRDTDEAIPADKDVAIDTNGKSTGPITPPQDGNIEVAYGKAGESTASGEVEVPLNTTADASKIDIVVNDASKEVEPNSKSLDKDNHKLTFRVWTKSTVVTGTAPTGAKALSASETKLRAFLTANNIAAYTNANTSSGAIAKALEDKGDNNLELWKSYVMGIEPREFVAPVSDPSADTSTEAVTLNIPAFKKDDWEPSGDYAIKYNITGGEKPISGDVESPAISIPLPTVPTDYTVKIVLQ